MRYVLFYYGPFSSRDWERFKCDFFAKAGYTPLIVDCINLVSPQSAKRLREAGAMALDNVVHPKNWEEVDAIVSSLTIDDIVLSFVVLDRRSVKLYQAFGRYKTPYWVCSLNLIPQTSPWLFHGTGGWLRTKYLDVRAMLSHVRTTLSMIKEVGWRYLSLGGPRYHLCAGSKAPRLTLPYPKTLSAQVIDSHSLDMERLKETEKAATTIPEFAEKSGYILYLDDALTGQLDFLNKDIAPFPPDRFFGSLDKAFNEVERHSGLPVIIAKHPKSTVATSDYPRPTIEGMTPQLVHHATGVLLHCSTSISFPVIYEKPLIFLNNDLMIGSYFNALAKRFASWFNQPLLNCDNSEDRARMRFTPASRSLYERYKKCFLYAPGKSIEESIWQCVLNVHRKSR